MESDEAKLFVGGISRETSEQTLKKHFDGYGTVLGSSIAKDRLTRNPRGFGFVWFSDPSAALKALQDSHVILGKTVTFFFFKFLLLCLAAEKNRETF
jgi:RNA-binding protein Musashi